MTKYICNIVILASILLIWPCKLFADEPIKIVATIGQIENAVEIIGGKHVIVTGLMGPGVDPHLYKASESDVRKISEADIIFYNGLYLEAKMEKIFYKIRRIKPTVPIGERIEKKFLLDSAQYSGNYDPHIWFDVYLWMEALKEISKTLCAYDKTNCEYYKRNETSYLKELKDLDLYVFLTRNEIPELKRVLVTAHDAFRYFGRRYGFEVIGLQGISTESEAGTADVMHLADFITKRKIRSIFIESSVPVRYIKAVQEAVLSRGWQVKIGGELFSDAMGDKGTFEGTYIGMVTHNIKTIVYGLRERVAYPEEIKGYEPQKD